MLAAAMRDIVRTLVAADSACTLSPLKNKKRGARWLPFSACSEKPWTRSADWGAARVCTRTRGVHADHAGLIGEVHVLSSGGRSEGGSRYRVRLVGCVRTGGERVAALGAARQHGVNQVC